MPIENLAGNRSLNLASRLTPRPEPFPNDGLVPVECVLDCALPGLPGLSSPGLNAFTPYLVDMHIPLGPFVPSGQDGIDPWMDHSLGIRIPLANDPVHRVLVVALVTGKRGDLPIEPIEQLPDTASIPCVPLRDTGAADEPVPIHHDVKLSPPPSSLLSC